MHIHHLLDDFVLYSSRWKELASQTTTHWSSSSSPPPSRFDFTVTAEWRSTHIFFIQTYDIRHLLFSPWHPHSGPTSMIDLPGSRVMACRFPLYQGGIASITLGKGNLRLGIGHYYECLQATSDWSLASIDDPIFTPCSSAPFIWTCPPIQRMFRILLSRFHIGGKGILQLNNNSIISILGFRKRPNLFRTNCEML